METPEVVLPDPNRCPICGDRATQRSDGVFVEWHCPRCGIFDYQQVGGRWRTVRTPDQMVRLSGWVREQNAAGITCVRIRPETAARVMQGRIPGLRERSSRVLALLAKRHPRTGDALSRNDLVGDPEIQGVSYSRDQREVLTLLDLLEDDCLLRPLPVGTATTLSVRGLLAAEELGASGSSSPQGFVAMWFDDSLRDAWLNGFDPGIRAAGFHPFRIDAKDYVGGITDEIMTEIRRSRFVVADYTGAGERSIFRGRFRTRARLDCYPDVPSR